MHRLSAFHLADSAFPTGGYAFSSGLEAAAKLGLFQTDAEFEAYLGSFLEQLLAYELPFLNSAASEDLDPDMLQAYHAGLLVPEMMKASLIQGRSLLRALRSLHGSEALPRTLASFPRNPDRRHFLLIYGFALHELGFPLDDIQHGFLYMNVRDWISSAVRLGCLGPMEGHRIQHRLLARVPELLAGSDTVTWREARRNAPRVDHAQAWHTHIYSKLFQS